MSHEELLDYYELYALGTAEEPERGEIRAHIERGCEVCAAHVQRARQLAALVGVSAPPAAPSARLRRRILASAGHEERHFGWTMLLAATTLMGLFGAVYFGGRERQYTEEAVQLRRQLRSQTIQVTRLYEAFAIVGDRDTVEASFGQGPRGKVFVNRSRGVLLIASNLPPAPEGKTYQMWVIPKDGKPVPAGLVHSDASGTAMHVQPGAVPENAAVVAVTLEPQGGSDQPTTTPLLAATLP
jgi:hypothetical protein